MVGFSSDPDIHFCVQLLGVAAVTMVATDVHVKDVVPTLGRVMPLHHMKNSNGSSVLDCSVWAGEDLA